VYLLSVGLCALLGIVYLIKKPKNKNGTNTTIQDTIFILILSAIPIINICVIVFFYYTQYGLKDNPEKQKEVSNLINEFFNKKGAILQTKVEYLGGYPELVEPGEYNLKLFNTEMFLYNLNKQVIIPTSNIQKVTLIDQTQAINNPKLSSLLIFGVVGLGIGNKDVDEKYCITIDYKFNDKVITIFFRFNDKYKSKENASMLYTNLNYIVTRVS
jgi:hypothetical protein